MSDHRLAQIRARAEAAETGWIYSQINDLPMWRLEADFDDREDAVHEIAKFYNRENNVQFAAHARQDIVWLLDQLTALQSELAGIKASLTRVGILPLGFAEGTGVDNQSAAIGVESLIATKEHWEQRERTLQSELAAARQESAGLRQELSKYLGRGYAK